MKNKLKTALIGFGRIGQANAQDTVMGRALKYASHAQVLAEHPDFDWFAVVDRSATARQIAQEEWEISDTAESANELGARNDIEVAVIATPPDKRMDIIEAFPNLKAVLVEKPLGLDLESASRFVELCSKRRILVQVDLLRRADIFTRRLVDGHLEELVGSPQAVFGIYGNGLLNNGTHMVDLIRMLFGEIASVQVIGKPMFEVESPFPQDCNDAFCLLTERGVNVVMQSVKFEHYRENGIDIWGTSGRFSYMHGGLTLLSYPRAASRMVSGEQEIVVDKAQHHESTLGTALYEMYSNLAAAINSEEELLSSGESALKTASVIAVIQESARSGGRHSVVPSLVVQI